MTRSPRSCSPFQPNYHHRRYCYKNPILAAMVYLTDLAGLIVPRRRSVMVPAAIRRIGILVTDHLGDALLVTPLIRNLHRLYPESKLIIITTSYARMIFQHHPLCHQIIQVETPWLSKAEVRHWAWGSWLNLVKTLKQARLDLAIDTRSDARQILAMYIAHIPWRIGFTFSGLGFLLNLPIPFRYNPDYIANYQVDNKLKLLEPLRGNRRELVWDRRLEFYFSPDYLPASRAASLPPESYWVLQVGGGGSKSAINAFPSHLILPLVNYVIAQTDRNLLIVGKSQETPELILPSSSRVIDLRDGTGLEDLAWVIAHSELVIGSSSVTLHLAACFNRSSLAVFSLRDSPRLWNPPGSNHRMLYHMVPCALCECDTCSDPICIREIQFSDMIKLINRLRTPERKK